MGNKNINIVLLICCIIAIFYVFYEQVDCKKKNIILAEQLKKITSMEEDEGLKRDIFLYISKEFRTIPKTISNKIATQIIKEGKAENIQPELIVGIIQVESSFNPLAISKSNARGLMQVMPEWVPKFKLKNVSVLYDIDMNINIGIKILKIHIKEGKGDINKGLYRYAGKSDNYTDKVYKATGKFIAFRSTIYDDVKGGKWKQLRNKNL